MNYTLKNEDLTAVISDIGGQTLSLSDHSGKEYIWHADPAIWEDHAPLLFPLCGEIKDGKTQAAVLKTAILKQKGEF